MTPKRGRTARDASPQDTLDTNRGWTPRGGYSLLQSDFENLFHFRKLCLIPLSSSPQGSHYNDWATPDFLNVCSVLIEITFSMRQSLVAQRVQQHVILTPDICISLRISGIRFCQTVSKFTFFHSVHRDIIVTSDQLNARTPQCFNLQNCYTFRPSLAHHQGVQLYETVAGPYCHLQYWWDRQYLIDRCENLHELEQPVGWLINCWSHHSSEFWRR
jgi:hypothetical protein